MNGNEIDLNLVDEIGSEEGIIDDTDDVDEIMND